MFTVFTIIRIDGVERLMRKGRAVSTEAYGRKKMETVEKGFLLDIGDINPSGLRHLDTFLKAGAKPVYSKGMPKIQGVIDFMQAF